MMEDDTFGARRLTTPYEKYFWRMGVVVMLQGDWVIAAKVLAPHARKYSKAEAIALKLDSSLSDLFTTLERFAKG